MERFAAWYREYYGENQQDEHRTARTRRARRRTPHILRRWSKPATSARGRGSWAYAHVLPGARHRRRLQHLCDHVLILGDAVIGDRVTVKSFVVAGDGLGESKTTCSWGPNVGFNERRLSAQPPRARAVPAHAGTARRLDWSECLDSAGSSHDRRLSP